MLKDGMMATGQVNIVLTDKDGKIKDKREIKNLVVDSGLDFIASRMAGASSNVMSHMALGSGTTAASNTDTDLESILGSRETLFSTTVTDNAIQYIAFFDAGRATGAVTEAGIFNADSSGDMLCRTVFDVVNKGADDSLRITWTVTISAS